MPALRCLPDTVEVALRDGTRACIRALVPEDRDLIAAAFERLSPRSRFMRFLSPIPRLSKGLLDGLVDVDHEHHVALAAIADGRLIGVARYVVSREDPDQADFAITVIDAHQGRGLGRALTVTLASHAAAQGLTRFTLDVHPENRVMLRLAASIGARLRFRDGLLSGTVSLPLHHPGALPAAA